METTVVAAKSAPKEVPIAKIDNTPEWKKYPEKGFILIKALNPKTQMPAIARPCQDSSGKIFTGQGRTGHFETISEEEKRSMNYVIDPNVGIALSHDKVIDLNDPIDAANWVWLRRHPYLELSQVRAKASRDARFYIEDREQEAINRVTSSRNRDKARYTVHEATRDRLVKAALLLNNIAAEAMDTLSLQDFLLQIIDSDDANSVNLVWNALNPGDTELTNAKIFLMELMKYKLIQRGDAGLFRFGGESGIPLGHTEELVLTFMTNPKNQDTIAMMRNNLAERKHIVK